MSGYHQISLDIRAIDYIKETARDGLSLAKIVSSEVDLGNGFISTFFPKNIAPENLYDFRSGGKLPEAPEESWIKVKGGIMKPTPNTNAILIKILSNYLHANINNICLFENVIAQKFDPWIISRSENTRFYKDEVYHLIYRKNSESQQIKKIIQDSNALYYFFGVCSYLTSQYLHSEGNNKITDMQLDIIAKNIEHIIVGAYDGESYLIWSSMPSQY